MITDKMINTNKLICVKVDNRELGKDVLKMIKKGTEYRIKKNETLY